MTNTHRHIAVIPGRAGSKGLPGKNRHLFGLTVDFIHAAGFFDRVIVSSDDGELLEMAVREGFEPRDRPPDLASDDASIKHTFEDVIAHMDIRPEDYLWLIFIPLVYKDANDFVQAHDILEREGPASLCSFVPAQSHPYYCWRVDEASGHMERFIDHDLYRRQDLPTAWEEYPYLCAIRADAVDGANSNLIRGDARPVLFSQQQADLMVDVDEEKDFDDWENTHPQHFHEWRRNLSEDVAWSALKRRKDEQQT